MFNDFNKTGITIQYCSQDDHAKDDKHLLPQGPPTWKLSTLDLVATEFQSVMERIKKNKELQY